MSYQVDAIYEGGVFKPLTPLELADQAHVKLTIEADAEIDSDSVRGEVERQQQAMLELDDELAGIPDLSPADGLTSADHDRILYERPA